MKITSSHDWRAGLAFDSLVLAADVLPGEPTRCAGCPADAAKHPRTELWAVKKRHPNDPAGLVRLYCAAHVPRVERAPAVAPRSPARSRRASAPRREPARRAPAAPERPKALCPDCFVEVPSSGVCGMCGQKVG